MLNREYFLRYAEEYGPFDLDGACDNDGNNTQVAEDFCCPARPFQDRELKNIRRLWLNAPYDKMEEFLGHYLRQKIRYPQIRAVFVVPKWTNKPWYKLLRNFKKIDEIPAASHVFTCPGDGEDGGLRRLDVGPTRWNTLVYADVSDDINYMPQALRTPPKTYWTHSKVVVTDGRRVLLAKEDNGLVWFPARQQETTDATPERTATRALLDGTGYRAHEPNLRLLGTETTGKQKVFVYVICIRPGSVPTTLPSNRAVWATWEELLRARSSGYLTHAGQQLPLRYEGFGDPINRWINTDVKLGGEQEATLCVSRTPTGTSLLTFEATVNGNPCRVLVDSGASDNFCHRDWLRNSRLRTTTGTKCRIKLANGTVVSTTERLEGAVLRAGRLSVNLTAVSTELDKFDVILGQPWLESANPDIDWSTKTIRDRQTGEILIEGMDYTVPTAVYHLTAHDMAKQLRRDKKAEMFVVTLKEVQESVDALETDQPPQWTQSLRDTVQDFADIIREPEGLPPEREWDFEINLECDVPPKERTYRMSPAELREVQAQLTELLAKGWIRPSKSPYGAPILFVRKKDGTMRMCVDYRKLNDLTRKDRTPLPRIDELLDSLHGAHCFSTLDLFKGYHQVRVKEQDIHKTAFRTHYGLYEYCVLPFGLTNAPASFQTMMNNVLAPYLGKFCVVYLDDVLIYSQTPEEHLRHIRLVLEQLQKHKLHVKLSKCLFGRKSVDFLGHIVAEGQVRMDPRKIEAVQDWPRPRTVTEVRGFLGLAGYYRKFIHNFAKMATPLTELTKKTLEFQWTATAQRAFEDVKKAMVQAPVLIIPDTSPTARYTLYTDASGFAVGAVLLQDQGHGLQPLAYHARKMNKH